MPLGTRFILKVRPATMTVWAALLPPWARTTMSILSASRSVALPLPSSPHWVPTRIVPGMLRSLSCLLEAWLGASLASLPSHGSAGRSGAAGEPHTRKDQGGAGPEPQRRQLAEQQPGEDGRADRLGEDYDRDQVGGQAGQQRVEHGVAQELGAGDHPADRQPRPGRVAGQPRSAEQAGGQQRRGGDSVHRGGVGGRRQAPARRPPDQEVGGDGGRPGEGHGVAEQGTRAEADGTGGSPRSGPAASPTNSGEQETSTVEEATVVSASEAFHSAKCSARKPPETASQPASRRLGRTRPGRPGRSANGASTSAPPRQRQKASASAGRCATRTRIGEVEIAATPTARPSASSGACGAGRVGGATPPAATAWPRGLIGLRRVFLKQFPEPRDEA